MGPWAITFGLGSAAAFVLAALFSSRANRHVSAFLFMIWAITNAWDFPTGSDHQLYLDAGLALLACLLCLGVMVRDRRSLWPFVILILMASWLVITAAYAGDGRTFAPWVRWAYQLASNVLYGLAVVAGGSPGVYRGAMVVFRALPGRSRRRPGAVPGQGWGRDAPDSAAQRKVKAQ